MCDQMHLYVDINVHEYQSSTKIIQIYDKFLINQQKTCNSAEMHLMGVVAYAYANRIRQEEFVNLQSFAKKCVAWM